MKSYLVILLLASVGATSEDINANEIKRRMKLIGGIPSYGITNYPLKVNEKPDGNDGVNYSEPELLLQYNSTSNFNPKGMGHLYFVTRLFMSIIQPTNGSFPDGKFDL